MTPNLYLKTGRAVDKKNAIFGTLQNVSVNVFRSMASAIFVYSVVVEMRLLLFNNCHKISIWSERVRTFS